MPTARCGNSATASETVRGLDNRLKRASLELVVAVACEAYDLARFRQRLGLAHTAHSFAQIAAVALEELRRQISNSANHKTLGS